MQGSDAAHNCNPNSYIRRSEVATILSRMMDASKRISFEMTSSEESTSASGLTVTQQPTDVAAALGDKAQFTVAVSGGKGPYTYKWYSSADGASWTAIVNSSQYSGCATATLSVKADASTALRYRCEITDATHGSVTSDAARLTVGASTLTVTQQPQDVRTWAGNWGSFTVAVSGGKAPYTYQWQGRTDDTAWYDLVGGYDLKGPTSAKLEALVAAEDFTYGYQYRCKITDANGSVVYSDAVRATKLTGTITRPGSGLTVTEQPQDVVCKDGDWVSFTVAVSGGKAPYTYQWQMMSDTEEWYDLCDNYGFTNTDSATLKAKATKQNFDFHCQHRCRITDANGSVVYSETARATEQTASTPTRPTVTVSPSTGGLTITKQPENASAPVDQKVSFAVEISGGKSPYSYQWQYSTDGGDTWLPVANSTKYGGVSGATLTVKIDGTDNSGRIYRCKISDAAHTEVYSDSVIASWQRPTVAG